MGRSGDSFNKKEREKKREKRKKDKAKRKEQRKLEGKTTEEFMYLDADGNLTATPPDPNQKVEYNLEDIQISTPKKGEEDVSSYQKSGIVKFFNNEKGFGFIIEKETRESYFVHIDSLDQPIKEHDKVTFEAGKGPKGPIALAVKKL